MNSDRLLLKPRPRTLLRAKLIIKICCGFGWVGLALAKLNNKTATLTRKEYAQIVIQYIILNMK